MITLAAFCPASITSAAMSPFLWTRNSPGAAEVFYLNAGKNYDNAVAEGRDPKPDAKHVGAIYIKGSPNSRIGRMKHTAANHYGSLSATPMSVLALIAAHKEARINNSILARMLEDYRICRWNAPSWVEKFLRGHLGSKSSNYVAAMERIAEISVWLARNKSASRATRPAPETKEAKSPQAGGPQVAEAPSIEAKSAQAAKPPVAKAPEIKVEPPITPAIELHIRSAKTYLGL